VERGERQDTGFARMKVTWLQHRSQLEVQRMTGLASRPSRQLKKQSNLSCIPQGTGRYSPIRYTSCSRSPCFGQFHDWKRYISIHARNERMRRSLKENLSLLLFLFVAAVVLWFILSRMRFLVFIPVSLGGFILFVIVVIVVLYLVLEYLLERS